MAKGKRVTGLPRLRTPKLAQTRLKADPTISAFTKRIYGNETPMEKIRKGARNQ